MKLGDVLEVLRRNVKTVVRLSVITLIHVVVLGAFPSFVDRHHAHTKAEHLPGFWAAFGFLGCLLIFVFSKIYGHLGISRKEDYYGD